MKRFAFALVLLLSTIARGDVECDATHCRIEKTQLEALQKERDDARDTVRFLKERLHSLTYNCQSVNS